MKTKYLLILSGIVFFIFSVSEIQAKKRSQFKKSRKSVYHSKSSRAKNKHKTRHINGFNTLPKTSIALKHRGMKFHYHGGKYFRHYAGNYINVQAPLGIRIKVLPRGYVTFFIGRKAYYYSDGVYYKQGNSGRNYEVIEAPIGAIVQRLPLFAERIRINNQSYFECNLAIYSKIRSSYGTAYKVVGHLESYNKHY